MRSTTSKRLDACRDVSHPRTTPYRTTFERLQDQEREIAKQEARNAEAGRRLMNQGIIIMIPIVILLFALAGIVSKAIDHFKL